MITSCFRQVFLRNFSESLEKIHQKILVDGVFFNSLYLILLTQYQKNPRLLGMTLRKLHLKGERKQSVITFKAVEKSVVS